MTYEEVADLYDLYVTAEFDVAFFLQEAKKIGGRALELMCGTGRISLPLLRAGIDLTCVDYSRNMLAVLREKVERNRLSCRVVEADITTLSLPERFRLIFIPFHSFQEIVVVSKRREALERIALHLAPGGRFICTLQNPAVRLASIDGQERVLGRFPMKNGGILELTSQLTFDAATKLAHGCQRYHMYDSHAALVESRRMDVTFALIPRGDFEELASSCGFAVEALYGDYAYAPFEETTSAFMIWLLTRSADT